MPFIQTRTADIGDLFTGTFRELFSIKRELAIYFGLFIAAGIISDLETQLIGPIAILTTIGYFVGQYYLYRALLANTTGGYDPRFKVFSFTLMAMILVFPILFGFNLFYIPGLLLAAKWVMAPTFLVAEEIDLLEAMGSSWSASNNNLLSLSVVFTLLCLIWIAVFVLVLGIADGVGPGNGWEMSVIWSSMHILPVLLMGLSVTAYKQLNNSIEDVTAVFE